MNPVHIPEGIKKRFVIVNGYYVQPSTIDKYAPALANGVTLNDGRKITA
jgi:hypothetical protein